MFVRCMAGNRGSLPTDGALALDRLVRRSQQLWAQNLEQVRAHTSALNDAQNQLPHSCRGIILLGGVSTCTSFFENV